MAKTSTKHDDETSIAASESKKIVSNKEKVEEKKPEK